MMADAELGFPPGDRAWGQVSAWTIEHKKFMRHKQAAGPPASLSEISDALRPFLISSSAVCPGLDPKGFRLTWPLWPQLDEGVTQ